MAKKSEKTSKATTKEEILAQALKNIREKFGDGAIMRLGDEVQAPMDVIPTGILQLDVALGIGGIPRGRVVEIYGPEGGGKTTIALHALAEAQKKGGLVAFVDAEHALDPRLAAAIGVDTTNLYLSQPDSGEQAFYIVDELVRSGTFDLIVVDSVAALTPQAEIDGHIGDTVQMGLHARLMSYALRRLTAVIAKSKTTVIFINQLRAQISAGYNQGPTETTTGGRALKFYSSLRIDVRRIGQIKVGDEVIGHELAIKVVKNKMAPPFRTAKCSLIYGKGVPKTMAVVDMGIDYGILKKKGSWITYKGESIAQGREKASTFFEENPDVMEEVKSLVLKKVAEHLGMLDPEPEEPEDDFDAIQKAEEALINEGVLKIDVNE